MIDSFSLQLIGWFSNVKRDLPWRKTKDPYKIWLSEIILQQTRVDQGIPYYYAFLNHFPTIDSLANASEQEVLKLWEGLGYYSRARNLHHTAKLISTNHQGLFPNTYLNLLGLKGIGPYTAAAISSIAFNEPNPVVDGNVFRFISRIYGVTDDIMKSGSRKVFETILKEHIPTEDPGNFNQAVMEYGATICTPAPKCSLCQFTQMCFAFQNKAQSQFPVKSKKAKVTEIFMDYVIFKHENNYLLRRRNETIWKGLFEFFLIEKSTPIQDETLKFIKENKLVLSEQSECFKHLLSHRRLWVTFYVCPVLDANEFQKLANDLSLTSFTEQEMLNLPRPKIIVNYLDKTVG